MIFMKEAKKEHCKISIGKLALRNLLFCHSGLDLACPVLDIGGIQSLDLWILALAGMTRQKMNEFNLKC